MKDYCLIILPLLLLLVGLEVFAEQPKEKLEQPHGTLSGGYFFAQAYPESVMDPGNEDDSYFLTEMLFQWKQALMNDKAKLTFSSYATADTTERGLFDLTQLFMDYQVSKSFYIDLGLKREVWGNGITWNPSNILSREVFYDVDLQRNRSLETQKGRIMGKAGYLFSKGSLDFYVLPHLVGYDGDMKEGFALATKISLVFSHVEMNLAALKTFLGENRETERSEICTWFSYAFPSGLTVFGDGMTAFRNRYLYPSDANLDENSSKHDEIVLSGLIGASYRFDNETVLRIEYFHNGYGYSNAERSDYFQGLEAKVVANDYQTFQEWLSFYELYLLSQNYVGASVLRENLWRVLDARLQVVWGINDQGIVADSSLSYHVNDAFDVNLGGRYYWGNDASSEFKQQSTHAQVMGGLTWHY